MNIYYDPGLILSSATFNFNISLSGKTFEKKKKKGLNPLVDSAQIVIFVFTTKSRITWAKLYFFSFAPPKTTQLFCVNYWLSLCAIWCRKKWWSHQKTTRWENIVHWALKSWKFRSEKQGLCSKSKNRWVWSRKPTGRVDASIKLEPLNDKAWTSIRLCRSEFALSVGPHLSNLVYRCWKIFNNRV